MQLSSLIGKKIISPSGERLGYVTGCYLTKDLKSLAALSAADSDEEDYILPVRAVKAVSDAVVATRHRIASPVGVPAPIGTTAFSEKGEDLGVVSDWLYGDGGTTFVIVKDGVAKNYPAETVAADGNVVVYTDGKRPSPKKKATKKTAGGQPTENDGTMSEGNAEKIGDPQTETDENGHAESESLPPAEGAERKDIPPKNTAKYELGSRNLLGRRVVRSVFDAQGEAVALAGDRITPEVLSLARRKGRLLALTVNTLTNIY